MKACILLLSCSLFTFTLHAQTMLSFCTSVEQDGYCAFDNTRFITSPDSSTGRIYMLLRNPNGIGLAHITYNMYTVDKQGQETFENSIAQNLQPEWVYAWQIGYFKTPGKFTIKVATDSGEIICTKTFELMDGLKN